jgi:hypothetical protein
VKSEITAAFRKRYPALPEDARKQARVAYRLFVANPYHRSLYFKKVHETEPIFEDLLDTLDEAVERVAADASAVFWIRVGNETA